ncbi:MAG: 1-deoxy-D-xylulose-5-phosphate synthase [Limisphaerales bacterium]|jgi:1-deoxy-D-xylulose-5-phosphate synthase
MSGYLDMVDDPSHIKKLTVEQLTELAEEVRQELITKLAKTGGHLGPNLGVVELTIAMHKIFSTPKDKFVWDVSHQAYVHKLFTGRKDRFHTIRTTDGLNGFALRTESEHDCYGAGHAGTAISAALGMCAARDMRGSDEHVVCVFGDAALTNGVSFEGLNNIAHTTKKFIGILNDNEWSIAKNVGAISNYLTKISTHPAYNRLHQEASDLIGKLPMGDMALKIGQKAEEAVRGALNAVGLEKNEPTSEDDGRGGRGNSILFEEFGLKYIGPIDGHNLPDLVKVLEFARDHDGPVVIHITTTKGKGFEAALDSPEKFHGLGPYDAATGKTAPAKPDTPPAYQAIFGDTMVKLCENDSSVVGITGAMPSGTGLKALEKARPDRYFDVGIAEEHAVLFAAGMATMGYHPVVAIYSTFLQRAYDCIHHDVALQDLPVIFCMDRAGLSANDGPTHHGLFDIAYMNCLPNMICMSPRHEDELADMMFTATTQSHPTAIRYPRGAGEGVPVKDKPELLEIGKAEVVNEFAGNGGKKIALFGLGQMFWVASKAADALKSQGYDVALINPRFTKPIDEECHADFAEQADLLITFEDHVLKGGYGSIVMDYLATSGIRVPIKRIGWPDEFIEHASSVGYLRNKHGLTAEAAIEIVAEKFGATKPSEPAIKVA